MILLICGPSGVGKTTLISNLRLRAPFPVITTLTTRDARVGERWKISITRQRFLGKRGDLFWLKPELHGELFGERYEEIMLASCSERSEVWLLDMGIDNLALYQRLYSRSIVLLPENDDFLVQNLSKDSRQIRVGHALKEHQEWLRVVHELPRERFRVLIARKDAQKELADATLDLVSEWSGRPLWTIER